MYNFELKKMALQFSNQLNILIEMEISYENILRELSSSLFKRCQKVQVISRCCQNEFSLFQKSLTWCLMF